MYSVFYIFTYIFCCFLLWKNEPLTEMRVVKVCPVSVQEGCPENRSISITRLKHNTGSRTTTEWISENRSISITRLKLDNAAKRHALAKVN